MDLRAIRLEAGAWALQCRRGRPSSGTPPHPKIVHLEAPDCHMQEAPGSVGWVLEPREEGRHVGSMSSSVGNRPGSAVS